MTLNDTQVTLLDTLYRQCRHGFVPAELVDVYDFRTLNALSRRGLIRTHDAYLGGIELTHAGQAIVAQRRAQKRR